jgi:rare lipoprotein A (peptidoglycan hydrolase)
MSRVSAALVAIGVLIFSLSVTIPTQSVARSALQPGSTSSGLVDGSSALNIPLQLAMLPAAPTAPRPALVAVLGTVQAPTARAAAAAPAAVEPVTLTPAAAAPSGGSIVIASWYGPGFYGNRTACGQLYTPQISGVAHKTLPCGTMLELEFRGRVVTVPVIDRGPFIAGRTLDLSNATRAALACTDLCSVRMQIR